MQTTPRSLTPGSDDGFAVLFTMVVLVGLLVFCGLAMDGGRAYLVKVQLTKAVDAAALGAARVLSTGEDPRAEAAAIFKANFKSGFMGTTAVDPTTAASFYSLATDAQGINTVHVQATEIMKTTFMALGNLTQVTVAAQGEATRRTVDLSLILDVSSSIGAAFPDIHDAAVNFINAFNENTDRLSLLTFSDGAKVLYPMPSTAGFNKATIIGDVPGTLPGGSTNMVEGLYRGWDELRSVPSGSQASLRVIVLFTDGASNSVPGYYDCTPPCTAKGLRTYDFPKHNPDPNSQTWDSPQIVGLFDTQSGSQSPSYNITVPWNSTTTLAQVPLLPTTTAHTHHRSIGIPTSFPLQTSSLTVNGVAQSTARGLRGLTGGRYPAQVFNINNAARNVLEIIADAARSDTGDYPIRIYTIGMGDLVRYNLGTIPETPESILKRISNETDSPDYNENQVDGKYFFAQTAADVGPAFQQLLSQIVRLTK